MPKSNRPSDSAAPGGWFASTHWSVLDAAASDNSPFAEEALERLCRQYWAPLFSYVRSRGFSKEDAEDLIQQFFARFVAKELFRVANRNRGRFRSFLLVALKNFLANEWEKSQAQKRGGGEIAKSLDAENADRSGPILEGIDDQTAVHAYEYGWAMALLAQAREKLLFQYSSEGREERFRCLEQFLPGTGSEITYAKASSQLGSPEGTIRSEVHRLKLRYREVLRDTIAQTVATPSEVDDELRHLLTILSRGSG